MRRPFFVSVLLLLALLANACKPKQGDDEGAEGAEAPASSSTKPAPKEPEPSSSKPEPEPPLPACDPAAIELAAAVDPTRYEADLRFIAAERSPGSKHWQAVQDRCLEVFEAAGFESARFEVEGAGVSVIGYKPGSEPELPGVVVGAHYDHIADCPGADDNASGTAAVLELARVLGPRAWTRDVTVACWDEEESGLHGSRAWVDAAVADGREFALYLNFDAVAYADDTPNSQTLPPGIDLMFARQVARLEEQEFRANFIALLADDSAHDSCQHLLAHAERLELPAAALEVPGKLKNEAMFAQLRRSDHASFWHHDIPAVFLSDTADFRSDAYHCEGRPDTVDTLDLEFALKVVRTAVGGLAELL